MFTTKILKYASRSSSPTRNLINQAQDYAVNYVTSRFASSQITKTIGVKDGTYYVRNHESRATNSANIIRRRCTISEPKDNLSHLRKTILNHPNIEKAVQLIENQGSRKRNPPHHIGSMPSSHVKYINRKPAKRPNIVESLSSRQVKFNSSSSGNTAETKSDNDVKPYVINIYLESQKMEPESVVEIDENSLRDKIKEFWEESMKEEEEKLLKVQSEYEDIDEEGSQSRRVNKAPRERTQKEGNLVNESFAKCSAMRKRRLIDGDVEEMDLPEVTPVKTNGFAKYITYWKKMFAARSKDIEIEEEIEPKDNRRVLKTIEHEQIFNPSKTNFQKLNPYDPRVRQSKDSVEITEIPRKTYHKNQKSHFSTSPYTNEYLSGKSKSTTHIRKSKGENFDDHFRDYSTVTKPKVKCDRRSSNDSGKSSDNGHKRKGNNDKTRVEDFVGKLKDAMASEAKDFKKASVLYNHNRKKLVRSEGKINMMQTEGVKQGRGIRNSVEGKRINTKIRKKVTSKEDK